MREAILSDIHGNLEATLAVEEALRSLSVEGVYFAGDAVGYGPDPNPCALWVKERAHLAVAGNHDYAAVGRADAGLFNTYARQAIEWTSTQLLPDAAAYLATLPLAAEKGDFTIVHANPRVPAGWSYIMTLWDADVNFDYFPGIFCFVGHSHQPVMVKKDPEGKVSIIPGSELLMEKDCRYLVNVGSVGQPRDGNPFACFGLLDREKGEFSLQRVPYEVERTQLKMQQAQLPLLLAQRLALGR